MSPNDDVYYINADPAAARATADAGPGGKKKAGRRRFGGAGDTTVGDSGMRSPILAATLSLLVCGGGQLYNGRRDLALLYFTTEVMVAAGNWCLWKVWEPLVQLVSLFDIRRTDLLIVAAVLNYIFVLFVAGNALQAFGDATGGEPADGLSRPIVSSLASLLLPGWGQFLNGQPRKAVLLMGLFATGLYAFALSLVLPTLWRLWDASVQTIFDWTLTNSGITALGLAVVTYLVAFYDALLVARRQRSEFS